MERDSGARGELIRSVARALADRLARGLAISPEPARWSADAARRFHRRAAGEGLLAFLADDPDLAASLGEPARREAERIRIRHLAFLADARAIARAFAARGIPHRFVYGLCHARLYPDPGKRPLQDLDVWIRARDAERAAAALAPLGLSRANHGDAVFRRAEPVPANVDLLTRVPPLDARLLDAPEPPDQRFGVPLLPPAETLAALLWRALVRQGRFRGLWLLDAALLADSLREEADRIRYRGIIAQARLQGPDTHLAGRLAHLNGPALPRPPARERRRPGLLERQAARLWDRGGFPGFGNLVETLWERAPAHQKAARLLRLAWPDAAFMDRRYGRTGPFGRALRRAARPVRLAGRGAGRFFSRKKAAFLDLPADAD